jgi:hypothetical protein
MIIDGELLGRASLLCAALEASLAEPAPTLLGGAPAMPEALARRAKAARPVRPARIERGQLWVAAPPEGTRGARALVILTRVEGARIEGLVAHDEAWIARDRDVIVPGDEAPAGQCLAVILDRSISLLRRDLLHFVGALPTVAWGRVRAVAALSTAVRAGAWGSVLERSSVPGGARATRRVVRRTANSGDATLAWLSGESGDDPDDPREEVHALLTVATAWLDPVAVAPPEVVATPVSLRARLDRLVGRASSPERVDAASTASLSAVFGPIPGALVGALRSTLQSDDRAVRLTMAVSAEVTAEIRIVAETSAFVATAHVHGLGEGRRATLTLRNLGTSEAVTATDGDGVILPLRLPVRIAEPVDLCLTVGDDVVRLAF